MTGPEIDLVTRLRNLANWIRLIARTEVRNTCDDAAARIAELEAEVTTARDVGRREGRIAERERMQRKEMRRVVTWLHAFADRMNDPHAKQVANLAADEYGRETAAVIRALDGPKGDDNA
ncbi:MULTISPECIES: hypothetical protein [Aurantimonas]|uniref:hypothetical protein n=1 Tax=Aurantimonas TaxID=182269 RepID=UPI0035177BCA